MVAKNPADRPQSMTEVVVELERCLAGESVTTAVSSSQSNVSGDALQQFLREMSSEAPSSTTGGAGSKTAKPKSGTPVAEDSASAETMISDVGVDPRSEQTLSLNESGEPVGVSPRTGWAGRIVRGLTPAGSPSHKRNLLLASIAAIVIVVGLVFAMRTPSGTLHLEIGDERIAVTVGDTGRVVKGETTAEVRLAVGEHRLHVERDDVAFETEAFEVTKGETVSIKVEKVGRRVRAMSGSTLLGHKEGRKSESASGGNALAMKTGGAALEFKKGDTVEIPSLNYDGGPITVEVTMRGSGSSFASFGKSKVVLWGGGGPLSGVSLDVGASTVVAREQNSRLTATEPHRVAAVFDGERLLYFIDGKLQGLGVPNPQEQKAPLGTYIGGLVNVLWFEGMLDEVRVSKVARYSADYAPQERFDADSNTLALYHFDEGQGDQLTDSSGHQHHGRIVGAKWVQPGGAAGVAPDRRAAEYVLSIGGAVAVNDQTGELKAVGELPGEAFRLTLVNLLNNPQVTVAGLANFKDCQELTSLNLYGTKVTDADLVHFQDCQKLTALNLHASNVTNAGLVHFKNSTNLASLSAGDTQLSDDGLAQLKDFRKLSELNIPGTKVTNAGLAHLKHCSELAILSLGNTQVTDAGLVPLKECKKLWSFNLLGEQVTDVGVAHLKDFVSLRNIHLAGTRITDVGLAHLKSCKSLLQIGLDDTKITNAGLENLKDNKRLTHLTLSGTPVTDAGLVHLKGCTVLASLTLQNTATADPGLVHLAALTNLTTLDLRKTKVTAAGIATLQKALPNCKVEWAAK